ncbi:MAG: hypothetical protein RH949_18220, partial [Coleofasciculus sp. A1-SPW-01]|uniref:hypothetical protein n=1 Tax=Coleofasciculus sp. A1-SPW-01 TaxID=3070819 RepID=UPI0033009C2F
EPFIKQTAMNTNPKNNDSLSLNFNVGGNSPPANLRYNGSPLAAFKMVLGWDVLRKPNIKG